jgi:predicted MPP superfamily phosphohydrolase
MKLRHLAALTFGAGLTYSLIEPHRVVVHKFDVALKNLPLAAEGLKIAQISDLHCSAITRPAFIAHAVQMCNALQPDVVALTGDFVSRRNSYSHTTGARIWAKPVMEYANEVAAELSHLQAPGGVYAVPGNHDHSKGNCEAIMNVLEQHGVRPLVNASTRIYDTLPLVGLDDLRAGKPQLKQAFDGIAPEEAQIVLSHNPRLLTAIANRNALMLSGHTHAGQVLLPLLPIRVKPSDVAHTPQLRGWYRQGDAQLYVNTGLGSVHFPMRFRCPPEIALFTLRGIRKTGDGIQEREI